MRVLSASAAWSTSNKTGICLEAHYNSSVARRGFFPLRDLLDEKNNSHAWLDRTGGPLVTHGQYECRV